ncbi:MAG: ABC transporter ATP-binding protein [Phycisphaerae bacterium]|nr:ABC transporter ATP-binding protein [Phycisphaerae bacterium]
MSNATFPLLCAKDLSVRYRVSGGRGVLMAVNDVTFDLLRATTLGLVGESGCGKTTLARAVLRLVPVSDGQVVFDGLDLSHLSGSHLRRLRRRMQIVFQDPLGSLSPRMTIGDAVGEGLRIHRLRRGSAIRDRVAEMLERVGLQAADMVRYPYELSGGQRQRVAIARALAVGPELLVCDEPVSALDVSAQAQILSLLVGLRRDFGLTYLFISHNLAIVDSVCDAVAVMYLGRFVEIGPRAAVFENPGHPYTRVLLESVPDPEPRPRRASLRTIGEPASPSSPPPGCPFHPRCPFAVDVCRHDRPELRATSSAPAHRVACHRADEDLSGATPSNASGITA